MQSWIWVFYGDTLSSPGILNIPRHLGHPAHPEQAAGQNSFTSCRYRILHLHLYLHIMNIPNIWEMADLNRIFKSWTPWTSWAYCIMNPAIQYEAQHHNASSAWSSSCLYSAQSIMSIQSRSMRNILQSRSIVSRNVMHLPTKTSQISCHPVFAAVKGQAEAWAYSIIKPALKRKKEV